jgi:hypothetical protein
VGADRSEPCESLVANVTPTVLTYAAASCANVHAPDVSNCAASKGTTVHFGFDQSEMTSFLSRARFRKHQVRPRAAKKVADVAVVLRFHVAQAPRSPFQRAERYCTSKLLMRPASVPLHRSGTATDRVTGAVGAVIVAFGGMSTRSVTIPL